MTKARKSSRATPVISHGTCRLSSLTGNDWRRNSLNLPKSGVGSNGTAPSATIPWAKSGRCRGGDREISWYSLVNSWPADIDEGRSRTRYSTLKWLQPVKSEAKNQFEFNLEPSVKLQREPNERAL